ncbi:hypothetical protein UA08_02433 [Talaromyces atroroseus]|uniref:Xylanolytic transcriptional activator regulatory domain-containing protein n=1 Tax=Talaromyces atroroseus TaxID=1441469 RepID=A0A225B3B2_TALAT|nr:hypothetical protein UA08_02433 [Talaromyces atroroseus]OKL61776.1 hypothetical protein UA08_02433 [Talaromyces atroroseus]
MSNLPVVAALDGAGTDAQLAVSSNEYRKRPRFHENDSQSRLTANLSSTACGRCRFRKVRHDDFSTVLYRLDEIDQTLGTLSNQFAEHSFWLAPFNLPRQHVDERQDSSNISTSLHQSSAPANVVLPSSHQELGQARLEILTERVELEHGGERTYKYPASMTLLKPILRRLADVCRVSDADTNRDGAGDSASASARAIMLRKLESFPFKGKCLQPVVSSDGQPVVAPPQLIARLFIDGFLRNINSRIPIFDANSLQDAVDTYYSGVLHAPPTSSSTSPSASLSASEHATDSTWAIIFTNIVLLELGLETHVTRWQDSVAGSSLIKTNLLTEDLISSLLRNCERALADLTSYTLPSLLHVQALLTLALVAQEFYGDNIFEKVLRTACGVSRMLGLHLSESYGKMSGESPRERERIFRVLYGLDKQRVFLTGDPCDLYHFDSDLELWKSSRREPDEVEPPSRKLIAAFDNMMMIWEEMYLKLYSARAIAAGETYSSSQVAGLVQLLGKWHEHYHSVMEAVGSDRPFAEELVRSRTRHQEVDDWASIQFELRYCYHLTHVLVLRYERSEHERAQVEMRNHARICLRLIVEMGNMGDGTLPTPSRLAKVRLASLRRVLGTYPIVAFLDLLSFRLDELITSRSSPSRDSIHAESQDVEADVGLIHAVIRILQGLQFPDRPTTYLHRLQLGLAWVSDALDEMRKAWLIGAQAGELSASAPSSSVVGQTPVPTDGSASIITSSVLDSSSEHLLSAQRQQKQQQQQWMRSGFSRETMDLDVSFSSWQPQVPVVSGSTLSPLELGGGGFGMTYNPTENWSAALSLDSTEEGSGGEHTLQRMTALTGGCGF